MAAAVVMWNKDFGRRAPRKHFNTGAANLSKLDLLTGPLHYEAQALYKRIGFTVRDPYYDPGPEWRDQLIFMEREWSDINA
jgi:hypothetical protein